MTHDPELTKTEGMLFELMRDGVISGLGQDAAAPQTWVCLVHVPRLDALKRPDAAVENYPFRNLTPLGAYMEAFNFILTRKLEGKPIYSTAALRKRRQLGLSD